MALELVAEIHVHAARKCQYEGHDVRGNMVVENAAEVGRNDIAGDQLGKIKTFGRSGRRCGKPFELGGGRQEFGVQGAEAGPGVAQGTQGFFAVFAVDDFEIGDGCCHSLGQVAGALARRGEEDEFIGHSFPFAVWSIALGR